MRPSTSSPLLTPQRTFRCAAQVGPRHDFKSTNDHWQTQVFARLFHVHCFPFCCTAHLFCPWAMRSLGMNVAVASIGTQILRYREIIVSTREKFSSLNWSWILTLRRRLD